MKKILAILAMMMIVVSVYATTEYYLTEIPTSGWQWNNDSISCNLRPAVMRTDCSIRDEKGERTVVGITSEPQKVFTLTSKVGDMFHFEVFSHIFSGEPIEAYYYANGEPVEVQKYKFDWSKPYIPKKVCMSKNGTDIWFTLKNGSIASEDLQRFCYFIDEGYSLYIDGGNEWSSRVSPDWAQWASLFKALTL